MAIERDYRKGIIVALIYIAVMAIMYFWQWRDADLTSAADLSLFILVGLGIAISFFLIGMMVTYAGEGSKLYGLKPIVDRWPAIKKPEGHVRFRTKMIWTFVTLILYFLLTNVTMYGLTPGSLDIFS